VTDKFSIAVTFRPDQGYVGTAPELRQPVIALSLSGLRRKVEALISPDDQRKGTRVPQLVMLNLDKAARLERDRRRLTARPRPGFAGTSA